MTALHEARLLPDVFDDDDILLPLLEHAPHAALRLKQGFGRLIRTASDRGAVIICDPRVVTKGYGRRLTEGLPPATRLQGPWAMLRDELTAFYETSPA